MLVAKIEIRLYPSLTSSIAIAQTLSNRCSGFLFLIAVQTARPNRWPVRPIRRLQCSALYPTDPLLPCALTARLSSGRAAIYNVLDCNPRPFAAKSST